MEGDLLLVMKISVASMLHNARNRTRKPPGIGGSQPRATLRRLLVFIWGNDRRTRTTQCQAQDRDSGHIAPRSRARPERGARASPISCVALAVPIGLTVIYALP